MNPKRIAVLGGGNGAHSMAADMALKGHIVNMFEMPEYKHNIQRVFDTRQIEVVGVLSGIASLNLVTDDIDQAVLDADYICIVTPAYAHQAYARLLKGKVRPNQVIVFFPGAFASLQLHHEWAVSDEDFPVIAETNNLPYGARVVAPGKVHLLNRNIVNIAFLPAKAGEKLIGQMREDLLPFDKVYEDVLACGLSLINPVIHSGPCILNISNIERPDIDFYIYEHGFTASAAKLDLVLDNERKAVAKALGYKDLHPLEQFAHLPEGYTWQHLYMAIHGNISHTVVRGPNDISNRYLTEDVPFGLVPWAEIGKIAGVDMPVTNSIINLYSIIHEIDWHKEGLTASDMGIAGMKSKDLLNYVKSG